MQGQSPPSIRVGGVEITGVPEDWSSHAVVFSDPGTELEAMQNGRYPEWQNIVNEPRYVMQQLRRDAPVHGPAARDVEYTSWWISRRRIPPPGFREPVPRDLPTTGLGGPGLRPGHYPAKFSLDVNTATCSDYVVFPTGAIGSGSQATIVAITNLYGTASSPTGGGCSSPPGVKWAYDTSVTGANGASIANLSPVISLDGTQVAFIQRNTAASPVASLVILKFGSNCTPSAFPGPCSPNATQANANVYKGCTAPCFTTISLNANDTNSAPFYRYDGSDILYVGDDTGKVHRIHDVFLGTGTPADTGAPWPVQTMTGSPLNPDTTSLTSPVYDFQPTPRVWVSTGSGFLTRFQVGAGTTDTTAMAVESTQKLECSKNTAALGPGFLDPPVSDPTLGNIYAFAGVSCSNQGIDGNSVGSSFVARFSSSQSTSDFSSTSMVGIDHLAFNNGISNGSGGGAIGNPQNVTPPTAIGRIGAFDNVYTSGTALNGNCVNSGGNTTNCGNIYACVNGQIFQIPVNNSGAIQIPLNGTATNKTAGRFSIRVAGPTTSSPCSPVTHGLGQQFDRFFVSITNPNGNPAINQCPITSSGCVYAYNIGGIMGISRTGPNQLTNGQQANVNPIQTSDMQGAGSGARAVANVPIGVAATSGIIVDNRVRTQIAFTYFTTGANPAVPVQANQTNLPQ
jgi:hypothetical protein